MLVQNSFTSENGKYQTRKKAMGILYLTFANNQWVQMELAKYETLKDSLIIWVKITRQLRKWSSRHALQSGRCVVHKSAVTYSIHMQSESNNLKLANV